MTFLELLSEIKKLHCSEKRKESRDYLEVVVAKESLAALNVILERYFGPPLKPAGSRPSWNADRYAKPYGGVRIEQSMYIRNEEKLQEVALLWPWGNGAMVTVKMIQLEPAPAAFCLITWLKKIFSRKS